MKAPVTPRFPPGFRIVGQNTILLNDFFSVINDMASGGVPMVINGENNTVLGTLIIAPCDTLAAQWLGKFKEGVSFAMKNC